MLMMHALFLIYSLTTVISKKIGDAAPLSLPFLLGFGLIFLCLGVYALGWQKVLQAMPLSKAFAHKAVVVIWGLFWGWALFGESLTPAKLLGAAVIICGVLLFASEEKGEEPSSDQKPGGALRFASEDKGAEAALDLESGDALRFASEDKGAEIASDRESGGARPNRSFAERKGGESA